MRTPFFWCWLIPATATTWQAADKNRASGAASVVGASLARPVDYRRSTHMQLHLQSQAHSTDHDTIFGVGRFQRHPLLASHENRASCAASCLGANLARSAAAEADTYTAALAEPGRAGNGAPRHRSIHIGVAPPEATRTKQGNALPKKQDVKRGSGSGMGKSSRSSSKAIRHASRNFMCSVTYKRRRELSTCAAADWRPWNSERPVPVPVVCMAIVIEIRHACFSQVPGPQDVGSWSANWQMQTRAAMRNCGTRIDLHFRISLEAFTL